jgi:hypothetical protein
MAIPKNLFGKSLKELRSLASREGVSAKGGKNAILAALEAVRDGQESEPDTLPEAESKDWRIGLSQGEIEGRETAERDAAKGGSGL